jgi:hypothetical protein
MNWNFPPNSNRSGLLKIWIEKWKNWWPNWDRSTCCLPSRRLHTQTHTGGIIYTLNASLSSCCAAQFRRPRETRTAFNEFLVSVTFSEKRSNEQQHGGNNQVDDLHVKWTHPSRWWKIAHYNKSSICILTNLKANSFECKWKWNQSQRRMLRSDALCWIRSMGGINEQSKNKFPAFFVLRMRPSGRWWSN